MSEKKWVVDLTGEERAHVLALEAQVHSSRAGSLDAVRRDATTLIRATESCSVITVPRPPSPPGRPLSRKAQSRTGCAFQN
jgi:hypothetical protein